MSGFVEGVRVRVTAWSAGHQRLMCGTVSFTPVDDSIPVDLDDGTATSFYASEMELLG